MSLLDSLTPEQITQLQAELNARAGSPDGRSPLRPRQLHDLTLAPTATDPRPLFIWSAEKPRNAPVQAPSPYPKLLWHRDTHQEVCVHSAAEEQARGADYVSTPPDLAPLSTEERARQLFESLSPEDQQLVLEQQRQATRDRVAAAFAGLTDRQVAAVTGQVEPDAEIRRGPGRPRKTA